MSAFGDIAQTARDFANGPLRAQNSSLFRYQGAL
jgi:hypothetical protein